MTCSNPPAIAHGHLINPQVSYVPNSTAQYGCSLTYSLAGGSTLRCVPLSTGSPSWQGSYPVCTNEFLESVANGHLINSQASYGIGSTAQYGCNAIYSMTGGSTLQCVAGPTTSSPGPPKPIWQGSYPICTLEFLETAWFWLLIGILGLLTLGLIGCLTWFCIRYCCNNCRRRRKVRDAEDVEEGQQSQCSRLCCGCCFYCMRTPEKTTDGCCDFFGCCGYAGCCSCCCWCCRCCREPVELERTVRMRQGKQKNRSIFSIKRQRSVNKKKKMALIKLRSQRQIVKSTSLPTISSTTLPTNQMVRSLIQDDPAMFRKVAKQLPVWMPHTHSIRDNNTSTK